MVQILLIFIAFVVLSIFILFKIRKRNLKVLDVTQQEFLQKQKEQEKVRRENWSAHIANNWSAQGTVMDREEFREKFEKLYQMMHSFNSDWPHHLRVIDGDLKVQGDLDLEYGDILDAQGLVVLGNLEVTGSILNEDMNNGAFLIVVGKTRAHAIVGGGTEIVCMEDAAVDEIVIGHYNDGVLVFRKNLKVPVMVNLDHFLIVEGTLTGRQLIPNRADNTDRWAQVLHPDIPIPADLDDECPESEFDFRVSILPRLRKGLPILDRSKIK